MGHRGPVRSLWHFNHLRTLLLFAVNMQIACAGPAVESRARILARHPHHQQQHHHHWRQWNANAPQSQPTGRNKNCLSINGRKCQRRGAEGRGPGAGCTHKVVAGGAKEGARWQTAAQQCQASAQDALERKLFWPPERERAAHLLVVLSATGYGSIWRQQPRGKWPQMLLQSEGVRRDPLTRLPRKRTYAVGSMQVSPAPRAPIKMIFSGLYMPSILYANQTKKLILGFIPAVRTLFEIFISIW